jgi:ABC-type nitrate/sulfonate/bicarbonate transport system permease component
METVTVKPPARVESAPASPLREVFRLYGNIGAFTRTSLILIWLAAFIGFWLASPIKALPYPSEVMQALYNMWAKYQLLSHVGVTLKLNIVGLLYASIISMALSYLSVIPFFQPLNKAIKLLRYVPIVGFTLVFLSLFAIGWPTKVAMLTTGMTFFLVTSMTEVINSIPRMKFELARVLGYSDWQIFYTVVLRPTLPQMIEMIAQNAAIGWVMITAIETYNRTEGGIGSQIYAYSSTNNLPEVYGLLLIIGIIALLEDELFSLLKRVLFPYSQIAERG